MKLVLRLSFCALLIMTVGTIERDAALTKTAATDLQKASVAFKEGLAAQKAGKPEEARVHFAEAVRLAPNQGLLHFHLGKVLLGLGQPAEARQAFKRALECGLPAVEQQEAQTATTAE